MPPTYPDISAAILAGGRATRLGGGEKALAELAGRSLLGRTADALRPLFKEILVVTPRREALQAAIEDVRFVSDHHRDAGPLAGIHAALMAAATPHVFIAGCDMPFLDADVIARLADRAPEAEIVLARLEERDQTLHAVYARELTMEAGRILREGGGSPRSLHRGCRVLRLDETAFADLGGWERSFWSVNSPEDIETAAGMLEGRC